MFYKELHEISPLYINLTLALFKTLTSLRHISAFLKIFWDAVPNRTKWRGKREQFQISIFYHPSVYILHYSKKFKNFIYPNNNFIHQSKNFFIRIRTLSIRKQNVIFFLNYMLHNRERANLWYVRTCLKLGGKKM